MHSFLFALAGHASAAAPCLTEEACAKAVWLHLPGPNPLLSGEESLECAGGLFTPTTQGKFG